MVRNSKLGFKVFALGKKCMVRIWAAVPVSKLQDQWLLGEHHELHVIVGALQKRWKGLKKGGWVNHPETLRWSRKLGWLQKRHAEEVLEFRKRGWPSGLMHETPLDLRGVPKAALGKVHRVTAKERAKDLRDLKKRKGLKPEVTRALAEDGLKGVRGTDIRKYIARWR
jgi:hypothetical protein